ncbi:calcyclin-binding protein, putative [Entamoeba invadens IP1]|uniref:Calcyclin-binding protein, putative n=1 Tax=Entamoeba invadens IP1 TaxID=370355 RepID=A0A0A1UB70_ENTIV|nr:calcyclin-binding protein, putative [Entamoeba invadens IP1]ELP89446.1 calcyclin-binding protein, putative [Entamoeba invadens IP1]|eukprot:XP_004256217.1 calcyclin-binding protein, putative [Entamoeba invadens IP1]
MQTEQFKEIAYEDRTSSMKLMLFLNGVGAHDKSLISVKFESDSLDVEVKSLNGVNYHLNRKVFAPIDPAKSRYTLSSNRINIFLEKVTSTSWSQWEKQKDSFKAPKTDDKDPQAGLMNMMKDMYEKGDDDMKRTIAKAWTEAQDKKNSGAPML